MNVDDFLEKELNGQETSGDVIDLSDGKIVDEQTPNAPKKPEVEESKPFIGGTFDEKTAAVEKSLEMGNFSEAMEAFSQAVVDAGNIPGEQVDQKHHATSVITDLHKLIDSKVSEYKSNFIEHEQVINQLLDKAETEVKNNNLGAVSNLFKQTLGVYNELPKDFLEKKIVIYNKIISLDIAQNKLKKQKLDGLFKDMHKKISTSVMNAHKFNTSKNFDKALQEIKSAEELYWKLPPGYLQEKVNLLGNILKKKNVAELSSQISSLQSELGESVTVSAPAPKKTEPAPRIEPPPKPEPIVDHESASIDEALFKIKLAKARIEQMEGNIEGAQAIVEELQSKNPGSHELEQLREELSHAQPGPISHEEQEIENKLDVVAKELASGQDEKALHDILEIERDERVLPSVGTPLKRSSKNIGEAIVHRRLDLAKKMIREGRKEEARKNIDKVLQISSKNEEALQLKRMVS